MEINVTTVIVAALGAGGLGAVLREVFTGIGKLSRGMSLKESGRKDDLVAERDRALKRAAAAEAREEAFKNERDKEERNRRKMANYAAALELVLIRNGLAQHLPAQPELEDTITQAQLREITGPTPSTA